MPTAVAPPLVNGNSVVPGEARRESEFLEQLLQIRDDVFASKHPRIRLPSKVLEQVAPRPQNSLPPKPTVNSTSNGIGYQLPPRPEGSFPQFQSPPKNDFSSPTPHGPRPFSAKPSSGIDPVLLTKSEHLIRAELQLKRQQLERSLKDQLDKKGRSNEEERETLDVENLLNQAHSLVPPVSGLTHTAASSDDAESFDENSYYSSKADSWSSSEIDRSQNTNADATDSLTVQRRRFAGNAELNSPKAVPEHTAHTVIDLDEEYEPTDELDIYEPEPALVHEDLDESDYSPPPAETSPQDSRRGRGRGTNGVANGSPNHSPAGPPPRIQNNRKRKREQKRNNANNNNNATNKRIARSPDAVVIKEEQLSPPPFASPLAREEMMYAREASRGPPGFTREAEPVARAPRYHEDQLSPSSVRPQRRAERADDLRRVASLQYARRPLSPLEGDVYAAPEPRIIRAASHAFAERPSEHTIYREGTMRPSAAPRYIHERSRSPVHEYVSRPQSPLMMAPPPSRQIVMDQYGNKYYAAPADIRHSVAPPSRMIEVDPYYERAVTREPTMRAPARTIVYEDDNLQRMPPPPPRRYVEVSDPEAMDARAYTRETSHRPVEVGYRPSEVIERRQSGLYDEMGPPRDYRPSRAFSVRPQPPPREIPEGYARHESVQPGHVRVAAPQYREVNVHQGPYDDRRYALPASSRRYADENVAERPMEILQEPYGSDTRTVRYRY
ncbi:hypothetical protein DM02DRAFT_614797 [Periconia macrospinosa]|uniref:Uncharacterized protein n=1 Tax=Periconia macrospinosa TaxID=97972 RepID=A0A2V1DQY7_9PLEO|nr:hypothetical protein DM02DRAFT_614797 [Periconia macrospinosa]